MRTRGDRRRPDDDDTLIGHDRSVRRFAGDHPPEDENDVNGENDDDGDDNDDDEEEVDVDGTANAGSSRQNAGDRSNASPRLARRTRSSVNPAARAKARRDRELPRSHSAPSERGEASVAGALRGRGASFAVRARGRCLHLRVPRDVDPRN